jgi:protein SCO1/2
MMIRRLSRQLSASLTARLLAMGLLASVWAGVGAGCSQEQSLDPPVQDELEDASFDLVTSDSASVQFPDAYEGDVLVVGYIYTHCPDVCSMITANMKSVRSKLDSTDGVRFVSITFDPQRDTPSKLAGYRTAFGIDTPAWDFLTGPQPTIDRLMKRMDIRVKRTSADPKAPSDTTDTYLINHTDQITLIDPQGRVRGEYMGSRTPAKYIVEDIQKIRS